MIRALQATELIQAAINDPEFIAKHRRNATAFTRNRKLSFAIVASTILQLAKRSLQIECNLLGERQTSEPASKQAFSQARYKMSYTAFQELNTRLIDAAYRDNPDGPLLVYDLKTHTFTVRSPGGVPRTMYKLDPKIQKDGLEYFYGQ